MKYTVIAKTATDRGYGPVIKGSAMGLETNGIS